MRKRFGGCAAAVLFACIATATPAHATAITFYTTGEFGSNSSASVVLGTGLDAVTLTFTGAGTLGSPVNSSTPNTLSFGEIVATGGDNNFVEPVVGETFRLWIFQTLPGAGSDSLVGDLSGKIKANVSNGNPALTIDFLSTSVTIAGITYTLEDAYPIAPPTKTQVGRTTVRGPGNTPLIGSVADAATVPQRIPEPASTILFGLSLLGTAAAARRRKARA